jgi:hypothetical protein
MECDMRLDRLTPTEFRLTMSDEELQAMVAAARCVLEPGCGELSGTLHARVERLVADYDEQVTTATARYPGTRPAVIRLDPPTEHRAGLQYDPF